jgi:DNA polymerase-3 subunit delta'
LTKKVSEAFRHASIFDDYGADVPGSYDSVKPLPEEKGDLQALAPVTSLAPERLFKTLQDMLGPDGDPAVEQLIMDLQCGNVSHAYLIGGRSKERNWDVAWAFAHSLLCENSDSGAPCGLCPSCRFVINQGAHPDLHVLEAGGASLKMEQVKDLRQFFSYGAVTGRHHVYLIRGPEHLTPPTANSLLKALEEPVAGTVFILVSEENRPPLATIVSRCRTVVLREPDMGSGVEAKTVPSEFEEIRLALESGAGSDLLRNLRVIGKDREAGKRLLQYLCNCVEGVYRAKEAQVHDRPEEICSLVAIGDCIEMLLRGLKQLDDNVNVNLLLVALLRDVQTVLASLKIKLPKHEKLN